MDIAEMHELFRLLGQQMGMEKIRVILPSSIDGYLNDAIIEIAQKIISSNLQTVYKDKFILEDNFVSPINGVSTLYTELNVNISNSETEDPKLVIIEDLSDVMYLYSFAINYDSDKRFRKCRFIENDRIESTLDDFCNRATSRYPLISFVGSFNENDYTFEVHCGNSQINTLKIKYIKMPSVVHLDENDSNNNVNCDLPQHIHKDVVELAVTKFFNSVGSTSHNIGQQ